MKRIDLPKLLFMISIAGVVFLYGFISAKFEIFPYSILHTVHTNVMQVFSQKDMLLGTRPTEQLKPPRYPGKGVTHHDKDNAANGLTLLTGFFDDNNEIRLIDMEGAVINSWPLKFSEIITNTDHVQPKHIIPKTDWNLGLQGALALPDGSIIFNFTYLGLVKLDRCGKIVWKLHHGTHHSLEKASDGGYWVPGSNYIESDPPHPNVRTPVVEDTILKVSEEGEIIKQISLLDILFRHNLQGLVLRDRDDRDIYHLNDIEELSSEMASAFPMFEAGDLMLSLRYDNVILVIDPDTQQIKWYQSGPWLSQHDPDFRADGKISVYNNNLDDSKDGSVLGGSSIMEFDPATREISFRYGNRPDQPFYSREQGEHQIIDQSGNILVTETEAGRVFEITPAGKLVWEYINAYDDKGVATVTGAIRYPADYFNVTNWSCSSPE